MKNQVKLFTANMVLAAAAFAVVGAAHADAKAPAHASSAKATVMNYLSQVAQQNGDALNSIGFN